MVLPPAASRSAGAAMLRSPGAGTLGSTPLSSNDAAHATARARPLPLATRAALVKAPLLRDRVCP